jgi:hypothetical protein
VHRLAYIGDSAEKVDRQPNFGEALLATPWELSATPLHALINARLFQRNLH